MFPGAIITPSPVQADALGVGREGGVARDVSLQHIQRVLLEALQGGRQRRSIPDCLLAQLRVLPVCSRAVPFSGVCCSPGGIST